MCNITFTSIFWQHCTPRFISSTPQINYNGIIERIEDYSLKWTYKVQQRGEEFFLINICCWLNSLLCFSLSSGLVPLHNACSYGHYEVTELLLKVRAFSRAFTNKKQRFKRFRDLIYFSTFSARSLRERHGSVAVHSTPRSRVQKPGGGLLVAAEPRGRSDAAQLPQQELRRHGTHPWAEGETYMWAQLFIYIKCSCSVHHR